MNQPHPSQPPAPAPQREDLRQISRTTTGHYASDPQGFWEATRDHDVQQNVDALLRHLPGPGSFDILDLGCGPGRDLATFRALGHRPVGLDGTPAFAAMARAHAGCEVWQQDLLALDLPPARFDGVFANAVLFHVPSSELGRVLGALHATLRAGGVLFASNPRGADQEGWQGQRYGVWHSLDGWRRHLAAAGFSELEHYYRPPGLPREQQPWLASVWRRPG